MPGIYIGSTTAYAGKNLMALGLGLTLQKHGYRVGYMKPIGTLPVKKEGKPGDEDALFVQAMLGLEDDPVDITPVVVDQDVMVKAFSGRNEDVVPRIEDAYARLSQDKDVMIVGGSGNMFSSASFGLDSMTLVKRLGLKTLVIDRCTKELHYDYLAVIRNLLGDHCMGIVLNDVSASLMSEVKTVFLPFLERLGIHVLGVIPSDPLLGSIQVQEVCERLGGQVITAQDRQDRLVGHFLIGTMQAENFITHFTKSRRSAVLVGGDRSDIHQVALEGQCECLIMTGNLYPSDMIITRAHALGIPLVVVRDDTYTVARKMEDILARSRLRGTTRVHHGAERVASLVDIMAIKERIGLG
ncbi:MAG: hypothetical protein CSA20_01665 [Deltaproteobacteria bacterium]|nr:MAG: hypothetical protein CSA20_01665 [Deltaproteobacteria bacterium]